MTFETVVPAVGALIRYLKIEQYLLGLAIGAFMTWLTYSPLSTKERRGFPRKK